MPLIASLTRGHMRSGDQASLLPSQSTVSLTSQRCFGFELDFVFLLRREPGTGSLLGPTLQWAGLLREYVA